jgi:hypothetical protein
MKWRPFIAFQPGGAGRALRVSGTRRGGSAIGSTAGGADAEPRARPIRGRTPDDDSYVDWLYS